MVAMSACPVRDPRGAAPTDGSAISRPQPQAKDMGDALVESEAAVEAVGCEACWEGGQLDEIQVVLDRDLDQAAHDTSAKSLPSQGLLHCSLLDVARRTIGLEHRRVAVATISDSRRATTIREVRTADTSLTGWDRARRARTSAGQGAPRQGVSDGQVPRGRFRTARARCPAPGCGLCTSGLFHAVTARVMDVRRRNGREVAELARPGLIA